LESKRDPFVEEFLSFLYDDEEEFSSDEEEDELDAEQA
jgi:hypothetical protein